MSSQPTKPLIFISYAHKDDPFQSAAGEIDWLKYVLEFLRPGVTVGGFTVWVDLEMMGGENWEPEIEQKLRACDIFILLVSRRSMASAYILNKELPIVRERDARGEPIHIYPLLLTPTPKIALDLVRDKNLRPRDGKPLRNFSKSEREIAMCEIADELGDLAKKITEARNPKPVTDPERRDSNELVHLTPKLAQASSPGQRRTF